LATSSQAAVPAQPPAGGIAELPLKIFINYRRSDSGGYAWALYFKLVSSFGPEHIFFDGVSLEPGVRWFDEIKSQAGSSAVFIALIGETWTASLTERLTADAEDVLVKEISRALLNAPRVTVIPVLINDAQPPLAKPLPNALKILPELQVDRLRHAQLADDIARLIARLEQIRHIAAPSPAFARSAPGGGHARIQHAGQ
jgi:hypothetical protein